MAGPVLSPKRQRFVAEYLIDLNATQAAIRAGYSEKTARQQGERLLTKVDIASAIKAQQDKRAERIKLDQDYVLSNLTEIVERCMQRAAITDAAGEETGVWKFDAKGATGAIKLIGEHLGMFNQKASEETGKVLGELVRELINRNIRERAEHRRRAEQSGDAGPSRLATSLAESSSYSVN